MFDSILKRFAVDILLSAATVNLCSPAACGLQVINTIILKQFLVSVFLYKIYTIVTKLGGGGLLRRFFTTIAAGRRIQQSTSNAHFFQFVN